MSVAPALGPPETSSRSHVGNQVQSDPLREVGILAIATYETDYLLVQESQLDLAARALREGGYEIR